MGLLAKFLLYKYENFNLIFYSRSWESVCAWTATSLSQEVHHKQSFYSRILLCNELIDDLHLSAVSVLWLSGVAACTQLLLVL